jgi:hypothetical protein
VARPDVDKRNAQVAAQGRPLRIRMAVSYRAKRRARG